jgi:hypothetical protein
MSRALPTDRIPNPGSEGASLKRLSGSIVAIAGAAMLVSVATVPAAGQAPAARALPRTADGRPDFSGIWEVISKANYNIEPHSASRGVPAGAGVVEGGTLPYQPAALEKRKQNYANRKTADTEAKCFLPGVPRVMYFEHPFQIVQTPSLVMMLFEYLHATRNVFMNTPHLDGPLEFWMGDSRGKWDGDTLVVDANNFNDETWFDRAGNHHSDALYVVERYTLTDADHIAYNATIEDPKVFTGPWKMNLVFYRHTEPYFRLLDYECYAFALDDLPIVPTK